MPLFPSEDWLQALAAVVGKDPLARKEMEVWPGGGVILVCEEDDAFDETLCYYVEPEGTRFREICAIDSPLDREAGFEVRASYSVWKRILTKREDPAPLIAKGLITVRGDREVILGRAKASKGFFHLLHSVPTEFADE